MRFLFLIRGDSEAEAALRPDERRTIVAEHVAYAAMLRDRGAYVLGEPLTGDVATVRPDDKPFVTDGPFAETKEAVGGFDLLECGSLEEAVEIAATHPLAQVGAIEVRPLWGSGG